MREIVWVVKVQTAGGLWFVMSNKDLHLTRSDARARAAAIRKAMPKTWNVRVIKYIMEPAK